MAKARLWKYSKSHIIHPDFNHLFAEEGQEPPQNDIAILNLETKLDLKPGIVQAIGIEDGGFSPIRNYFIELIEILGVRKKNVIYVWLNSFRAKEM